MTRSESNCRSTIRSVPLLIVGPAVQFYHDLLGRRVRVNRVQRVREPERPPSGERGEDEMRARVPPVPLLESHAGLPFRSDLVPAGDEFVNGPLHLLPILDSSHPAHDLGFSFERLKIGHYRLPIPSQSQTPPSGASCPTSKQSSRRRTAQDGRPVSPYSSTLIWTSSAVKYL